MSAADRIDLPADEPPDREGFARLTARIHEATGFRCGSYKERCLRRRIGVRMRARAVHTFDDYLGVLEADEREWGRLLDALTVNVTRFFRDPSTFDALDRHVLPTLWQADARPLRVWSAGCASGEETYSLAMLLHRHAQRLAEAVGPERVQVLGTDIDRESLATAAAGLYPAAAAEDLPADLRERHAAPGEPLRIGEAVRALVRFERHDLLHEPPPGPQHLVVCRNVLIYFDRATQERTLAAFRDLLAPGGVLVLGRVETLLGASRQGFAPLAPRERIFVRL